MKPLYRSQFGIVLSAIVIITVGWSFSVSNHSIETLQGKEVPLPDNLDDFVKDRDAAIQLGKALFWDMQLGADGVQTCASCHFAGGADNRIKNQMRPAGKDETDILFSFGGPNYTLRAGDFPFPKSANEVAGSQGTYHTEFLGTTPGAGQDDTVLQPDPVFNVNGINTRQVALRNAPTVINAIFMSRGLWDGRANNQFNGRNPFGPRDASARIWVTNGSRVWDEAVALDNAAMASVATGPPTDNVEISSVGRTWPFIGKRMLPLKALAGQQVDATDSHLSALRDPSGGLTLTYADLVARAFRPRYQGNLIVRSEDYDGTDYDFSQTEENFSLYAGLSIMMYISTQVSDQSPYDDFANGNSYALNSQEQEGLDVFLNKGKCVECHSGPDFTNAGFNLKDGFADGSLVNTFRRRDGKVALYDRGFFNVGVRNNDEDHGLGRDDDLGNDLSFSEQFAGGPQLDPFSADPGTFDLPVGAYPEVAVEGAIKTPGLRNIELNAPYMRSGGFATLRQVVDFFDRGGDFAAESANQLHPAVQRLYLSDAEKDALVAFMLALTDDRVRDHSAPFDHPQIFLANGHEGDHTQVWDDGTGKAATDFVELPAVGRYGYSYVPTELTPFQERLGLTHYDGTTSSPPPGTALCYVIADNDADGQASYDVLTALPSGAYGADVRIGQTGTEHIEAAAFNPWSRELYAANARTLGTINLSSGAFQAIGDFGWGEGYDADGNPRSREFLDVDGLAFDPVRSGYRPILYGTVRKVGEPDLLIQIDPATGGVIKNAFGSGQDYVTIRGIQYLTDIDDIAVSPWDGKLYAVNNRDGQDSRLVTLNSHTGVATPVLELPLDNVEGLAFFGDGTLYGTAGEGDESIVVIDLYSNTATIQARLGAGGRDYEAIDCLTNTTNRVTVTVFGDANDDGSMQIAEGGKAGVAVGLFRDANLNGFLDAPDLFLEELVTDSGGRATFRPAATGEFLVKTSTDTQVVSFAGFGETADDHFFGVTGSTSTASQAGVDVPSEFALLGNYPNPFNPQTTAVFQMPLASHVRLSVFNVLGREVSVLVDGIMAAGNHEVTFQAQNLPSGTYLLRMAADGADFTRTITLLK
jgi:cytochrome c peroxidase